MTSLEWFPIQPQRGAKPHPLRVPWSIAEKAYSVYAARYGTGQTLQRFAQRGGFGPGEMDDLCPGWREECSEVSSLRADIVTLRARLLVLAKAWADHQHRPFSGGCNCEICCLVRLVLDEEKEAGT